MPIDDVQVREIVERAEVAHSVVFHHFANKRGLYLAALRTISQRLFDIENPMRHLRLPIGSGRRLPSRRAEPCKDSGVRLFLGRTVGFVLAGGLAQLHQRLGGFHRADDAVEDRDLQLAL